MDSGCQLSCRGGVCPGIFGTRAWGLLLTRPAHAVDCSTLGRDSMALERAAGCAGEEAPPCVSEARLHVLRAPLFLSFAVHWKGFVVSPVQEAGSPSPPHASPPRDGLRLWSPAALGLVLQSFLALEPFLSWELIRLSRHVQGSRNTSGMSRDPSCGVLVWGLRGDQPPGAAPRAALGCRSCAFLLTHWTRSFFTAGRSPAPGK